MPRGAAEYKYGVEDLAKALGVGAQQVRVKLRKNEVEKNDDGVYGWNSQNDFKSVLKDLEGDGGGRSAPAKKTPGKKTAAKGKGGKPAPAKKKRTPRSEPEAEAA